MSRVAATWISLGVAAVAGCASGTAPPRQIAETTETTKATKREEAPMTGAASPAGDPHPGTIEYEDRVEHRTWTRAAAEVPPTIAWVQLGAAWKPVVKIEINGAGDRREITKFGPNHEFLETTTAHMGGPPPAAPAEPVPTLTPTRTK